MINRSASSTCQVEYSIDAEKRSGAKYIICHTLYKGGFFIRKSKEVFRMNNNTAIEIDALRRAGYTPTMIAEKLGISVKAVDNAMQRIRKKLH